MKHYIAPIGAVAAIALLAACSGADTTVDTAAANDTTAHTEMTDTTDTTVDNTSMDETEMARASYVMAAGEYEASELIGAPSQIVFRDGGILGVAGDLGTLPFSSVTVKLDAEGEPEVSAALVDESLEGVAEFEQDGLNDYSLASELMGTNAELAVADNYTRVTDLIMDTDGHVKHGWCLGCGL